MRKEHELKAFTGTSRTEKLVCDDLLQKEVLHHNDVKVGDIVMCALVTAL